MKTSRKTLSILTALAGTALAAAAVTSSSASTEEYVVRKGQTASYIALLKYGAYNDSIAALLKADNPQIDDLDRIQVGQVIKLRKDKAPVAAEKDPQRRIQMASRKAVVTFVEGSGEIRRAKGGREPLLPNRFLATGDSISTAPGALAEIIVDNQSVLRLSGGTEVILTAIQEARKPDAADARALTTRFALLKGKTWTKVQKWAGSIVAFQVRMPNAIAGVHGTVFQNDVNADSTSAVSVYQGEVGVQGGIDPAAKRSLAPTEVSGPKEITAAAWIQLLKEGQTLSIAKNGTPGAVKSFSPNASDWEKTNLERDCLCD
jgi:hypothetical protein